jgi:hypothetical protein
MIRPLSLLFICALTLMFCAEGTRAQTTVTFGTGTSSSTLYGPFYRASATSTVNTSAKGMLYTSTELANAGIVAGSTIQSIKWSKASASILSATATAQAVLYVKDGGSANAYTSGMNVLNHKASGFVPVDTLTFDGTTNNIPGAATWIGFNFNWNYIGGTLEFYVEWTLTGTTTGSFTWNYTSTTPDTRFMYEHAAITSTSTFTTSLNRGNVQIVFVAPPACSGTPTPGNISGASSVCAGTTTTLAITGQSAGSGLTYQWEWSPAGAGTWTTIAGATNPSYTTPAVMDNRDYRVLVTCTAGGGGSAYTNPFTLQMAAYAPPYSYGFSGWPGQCWIERDGVLSTNTVLTGTTSSWAAETWLNATGGSDIMHDNFTSSVDNEWMISPTMALGAGGNYQLEFDVAFVLDGTATPQALGSDDTLAVVISTDNGLTWSIANVVKLYTSGNSLLPNGYEHVTIPLTGYTGNIRIGFYASEGTVADAVDTDGMIDNFIVQLAPTCPTPAFPASTNVTGYAATLSWTETGTATQWQVQYGPTGFTLGTGNFAMAGSNPYTLTGLTPLTGYDTYVRSVCGPADTSAWSFVTGFTTTCGFVTLPYLQDFATYTPSCWEERDGQLTASSPIGVASSVWAADDWLNNAALGKAAKILLSVATDRDWLVSPSINLGTSSNYQLEFDVAFVTSGAATPSSIGSDDSLAVVVSTDDGATWSNTNILYTWTATNSALPNGWMHVILPLTSYTGTIKIGFYGSEGAVNDPESVDVMIDNFSIVTQPSCPQPTFLTASAVNATTMSLGWTQAGPATQWQVEYGTAGTPFGSGTRTVVNTNPYTLSGLTSITSYAYYVRTICGVGDTSVWSGPMSFTTPPPNDNAVNATMLTLGALCNGTNSNGVLAGGTAQAGEPSVTCQGSAGNFRSVWYKFIAPASGQVKISNDYTVAAIDSVLDTKMAVYQVGDSSNFSTYQIIGCDDDNGVVGSGYRNLIYVTSLIPGNTYYIKVDKWNSSEIDGSFCITVEDFTPAMISSNPNCAGTAYGNSDWYTGGNAWVSVVDNSGLVIANIKSNGSGPMGSALSKFHQNIGPIRIFGSQPYLDRNYTFEVDAQPTVPVSLQFFFTDADYNALAVADPNVSMGNLGATRLPTAACAAAYDTVGQAEQFLAQTANGSNNGVRYIVVPTPGFSSYFIHAGYGPLAIDLKAINATNVEAKNRIDWSTGTEQKGDRFVVERSANGISYSAIGEVAAKGSAGAYSFWDESPFAGINYYRLRLVEVSEKFSYSSVVTAAVKMTQGFAVDAYPNPAGESVTVRTYGERSGEGVITITDLSGRVIFTSIAMNDKTTINIHGLAKGMYLIRFEDNSHSKTIKLNKL